MPTSDLPEVAFAGRSNVGKSSLLNALVQRRGLARTSSTPGCTRQINVFDLRFADASELRVVDLPGFGYARRSKQERVQWGTLIEGYLKGREKLVMLVLLVDARRGLEEEELQLLDFMRSLRGAEFPCVCVVTKTDKLPKAEAGRAIDAAGRKAGRKALGFSAKTGDGREALWRAIRRVVVPEPAPAV